MIKKIRGLSIKSKLIGIQLVTTLIVLLLLGIFVIFNEWKYYHEFAINQLSTTSQLLKSNFLSTPFKDAKTADKILHSLKSLPNIVNAEIIDSKEKTLARYNKAGYEGFQFNIVSEEEIVFNRGFIRIKTMFGERSGGLGMLFIRLDLGPHWQQFKKNVLLIIFVFLFAMVAAYFLSLFLQGKIARPLLELTDNAEKVMKTGDYSIRMMVDSNDEIGYLKAAFNRMMTRIEKRETELFAAREQLQTVLDAVPGTISWITSDLKYIGVNKGLTEVFGMKAEEFVGQHLGFMGNSPDFVTFVEEFFKGRDKRTFREVDLAVDGKTQTHLIIGQKYGNDKSAVFIGVNITRVKEAEQAIKVSEERFALVLEASNSGIWDFDFINDRAYYSPRWKTILGFSDNEIKDKSEEWEKRLHPDEKEWVMAEFDRYLANPEGILTLEYRMKHKNGSYLWVFDRSIALVGEEGKTYRMLGSMYDITARKESEVALQKAHNNLEAQVAERTKDLAAANERLKELDRLKSMFLASMSHELRTPLNSIIGFTGILLMGMAGELNDEQKKQLTMVKNSAGHLLALINDILDISKIEAEKIDLDIHEFDCKELLDEIVSECTPLLGDKKVTLSALSKEQSLVMGDRRRIKQVIVNLVSNAIKFTEKGTVKIVAEKKYDKMLDVAVTDTGIGIKEEDLEKLFKPFQQLDMSSSKKYEGTGLGLHLSQKLARLMGGKLIASSQFGKGSHFIFSFPFQFLANDKRG